jgi:hypothetical protein
MRPDILVSDISFLDNHIGIAVDLLIIDPDRYEALKNEIGLVYKTINKEGKVVYGACCEPVAP